VFDPLDGAPLTHALVDELSPLSVLRTWIDNSSEVAGLVCPCNDLLGDMCLPKTGRAQVIREWWSTMVKLNRAPPLDVVRKGPMTSMDTMDNALNCGCAVDTWGNLRLGNFEMRQLVAWLKLTNALGEPNQLLVVDERCEPRGTQMPELEVEYVHFLRSHGEVPTIGGGGATVGNG